MNLSFLHMSCGWNCGDGMRGLNRVCGLTYAEVVIAAVFFVIAALMVIPAFANANRNMVFAHESYVAQQQAQSVLLIVRDGLTTGSPIPAVYVYAYENGGFPFSIWVRGSHTITYHSLGAPANVPDPYVEELPSPLLSPIVIAVWCEDGRMLGRAMGVLAGG